MTERAMQDFFERIEDHFVTNEAGDEVFWPPAQNNGGYYDAHVLRAIATELDKRNAPWRDRMEEYFEDLERTARLDPPDTDWFWLDAP